MTVTRKLRRVLITDPYTPQSYDIVCALQSYCEKIVVVLPKVGRFPRLFFPVVNSRLISKVYAIKSNQNKTGLNSEDEKNYIEEILDICTHESIDVIYPSSDDEVFLLSKYKNFFEERGITVPVNEYQVLRELADKFNVIQLAQKNGIPCPKTILASDTRGEELLSYRKGAPLAVIKPRFGNASKGVMFIDGYEDLVTWTQRNKDRSHQFIVQEYIPGNSIVNLRVYLKQDGDVFYVSCSHCARPQMLIHQSSGIIHTKHAFPLHYERVISLFRKAGFVGYGHAQFKVDSDLGIAKLIEINVRLGRGTWTEVRQGINRPLLSLDLFEGKQIEQPVGAHKEDVRFVYPMQDVCIFMFYLWGWLKEVIRNKVLRMCSKRRLPRLSEMYDHYYNIYVRDMKKNEYDNYWKYFFRDPLVSLSYWFVFAVQLKKRFNEWSC